MSAKGWSGNALRQAQKEQHRQNKRARSYLQHGAYTVRKALAAIGDMDTWLTEQGNDGEAAKALREKLIEEQDGLDQISRKELVTIDATLSLAILAHSIGRYIGTMDCPVNKVKRTVFPVVRDYVAVQKALRESFLDLNELRLKRPKKEPITLDQYCKERYGQKAGQQNGAEPAPEATHT